MFSTAMQVVLNVAYREAQSRRHAYLTLEHLLYALLHDPDGERILRSCGADPGQLRRELDGYLRDSIEQFPRGRSGEPEQTQLTHLVHNIDREVVIGVPLSDIRSDHLLGEVAHRGAELLVLG